MIGDKVIPKPHHKRAAGQVYALLKDRIADKRVALTIAGESGSGKSEIASELAKCFEADGHSTIIFQQDDYFFYPPKTNHEMRLQDIKHVGLGEVNLSLLNRHLESFKISAKKPIDKPLVVFDADRITKETISPSDYSILLAEGTYTTVLTAADFHIFIDRSYKETLKARMERARDKIDTFTDEILKIEHNIISKHKKMASIIIDSNYNATLA